MFTNTKAFASFAVDDVDEARRFYGDTLGLETSEGPEGVLVLKIEGGIDTMVYPKPDHAPATYTSSTSRSRTSSRRSTRWSRRA
jgi:catechol 2,3-dioxygenase-like lactoylglutathione lyase family enzyme